MLDLEKSTSTNGGILLLSLEQDKEQHDKCLTACLFIYQKKNTFGFIEPSISFGTYIENENIVRKARAHTVYFSRENRSIINNRFCIYEIW